MTAAARSVANGAGFALNEVMRHAGRKLSRLLWSPLLAAVLLRAIIPLGYMPGNVLAGEFMVLCPAGLPATMLSSAAHAHHGDDAAMLDADKACPIASALKQAALPPDLRIEVEQPRLVERPARPPQALLQSRTVKAYQSRAPPRLLS